MQQKLLLLLVSAIIATVGLFYLKKSAYPYVLASKEARESIEVTQEQLTELKAATLGSDRIAYAIIGAVIAGLVAFSVAAPEQLAKRVPALGAGVVLGGLAGYLSGGLAHWFLESPQFFIQDAMVHSFAVQAILFLPIAIAIAASAAVASRSIPDLVGKTIAAVLGALAMALLFAVLNGTVTQQEQRHMIFPGQSLNRILLFLLPTLAIGFSLLIEQNAANKKSKKSETKPNEVS